MISFRKFSSLLFFLIIVVFTGCVEPYLPPSVKNNPDFLVVDAFINAGAGVATVIIIHTTPLQSNENSLAENGADVTIRDDLGNSANLTEYGDGKYEAQNLIFSSERKYQLHFRTSSNREYQSDLIQLKDTSPIDSVTYFVLNDDLYINVNSHDPTGDSRYYRWKYFETYEYKSQFISNYILRGGQAVLRADDEMIYRCWKTDAARKIVVGTTTRLVNDVVSDVTILRIPKGSLSISEKYSILVQQQSISASAYAYWSDLQKTTESLGGLFDPIPGQVTGNIHSLSDPGEQVIGYFDGGFLSEKRIFITPDNLPKDFSSYNYPYCEVDSVMLVDIPNVPNYQVLISGIYPPLAISPEGYTAADAKCVDCRVFAGGVTQKPEFWE